ncbi:secretory phospholipase A2 receptor-like protein [Labeo rohita]|uniref:Secretory phospholipase A2 receptor-like protein n=1 Tax=Labeo rohita TaxID=84645 RepID=A0A498N0K4_LABRO|nr:secretory phospholipase A2 receptor-like protein [Labeo rohita]
MRGYTGTLRIRLHEALYALYMLFYVSSLACAAAEVSDKTEVWNKTQLLELYSKGVFQLESISLKLCLSADSSGLSLTSCEPPSAALLWKWVSRHRLYNLGTNRCLGINATKMGQPDVGVFECDVSLPTMWWRCGGSMLYSVMVNKLAVVNSKVVVVRWTTSVQQWRVYGAAGEGPYTADLTSKPVQDNQQCGVFNSTQGSWQSLSCESALPYICKKTTKHSQKAEPLGSNSKVWIGLHKEAKLSTVQWSDGTPVTFTSWYSQEPSHRQDDERICVTADRKEGRWQFDDCEEQHAAICKVSGLVPQHPTGEWDEGCPEGWRRKGNWCYKITDQEQTFEDAVKGYYCRSPLVTVENRFEQAFLNSLISEMGDSESRSYWTALQDRNKTGEYRWLTQNGSSAALTYTNWNRHQPVIGGGCVVMSGGRALGHWEVKNCHTFKALAVCKQEVSGTHDTLMPSPHIDLNAPCPTGWESRKGLSHCYKVYHIEKILMHRTWTEAQFFCRALGADLASFHHYEDQVFVKNLLSKMFQSTEGRWFWVGFTKRNPQSDGAWEWSDGTPVVTSFIEGMNEVDSHMCAVYSDLTNTLTTHSCDSKYEWICKVPRGAELVKPYWYSDQHEPWVFFHGAEYYFVSKPFPWESVSFACKMMGADLLSVHSSEELGFIRERINKDSGYWWIGLSANSGHNGLSWTDGSALDYENWENGRFSQKPGQNCIQMSSQSGQWSTGSCKEQHGYVCKRRTVSIVEDRREPHYVGSCPENWFYYRRKCLFLYLPTRPENGKTWQEAQSICSSYQGTLVSIEDEIEQAYIVMLLRGCSAGVWIGARGRFSPKWSNGKPVSYKNWEMTNYRSPEEPHCTYLSNSHNFRVTGLWQDDICTENVYGFVCQKPQDITKRPTQSYYTASSLDSSEYKNHSYRIIHGNLSWYQAQKACLERGASLVSITDAFHQAYLTVLVKRLEAPHWIGLYSTDDGISYQWSDGSEVSFTYWEVSNYYPEGPMGDGGCVSMDVNGRWKDVECDMLLSGAICYIPPPKSIAFSYEVVCPETWVKFRGSCYYFESVILKMTLEEARNHCKKMGNYSDVMTVQDDEESRFFLKEVSLHYQGPQNLWLGILYDTDTDALTRLDGSPLHYTNWRSKAPDANDMRADSCVTMRVSDAVWQLADCTDRLGFICKTSTGAIKEVEVEPLKGDDTFTIQHNSSGKCLLVQGGALKLGDCSSVPAVSWKWGSAHRLFHMESSMCLGLEVRSKTVTLFSCDSTEILRWKCYEDIIYTEYQMKLSVVTNNSVTAKRDGQDTWKRGGSSENICQQPYRRMHTSGGNSNGAPCEFPFLYNGTWHHNCLPDIGDKTLDWCSTTANYDQDEKWGNCLKYVKDQKDLPSKLWIGLNHLDWMQGWQWSDGSALSFAPWETGIPIRSLMSDEDCGILKEPLRFGAETCEHRLPFICMKNEKDSESTAGREVYKPTVCEDDWIGWKGFCYKLHSGKESKLSQHEAQNICRMNNSQLASIHSLDDIEMLHTHFHSDLKTEVWIGLSGDGTTSVFEWADKVPVSFTYWARAQPPPLLPNTIHCVYYAGEHHTWSVSDCDKNRAYMCMKKGSVNESAPEEGCPRDGNWKRHGDACYKVDTELVFYKNSCHITINNRFEQAFINSLLKEHISTEVLYFWTGLQDTKGSREYQWISQDGTADRVTYTNWKWPEPTFAGGCVVMSTGNHLGQWAVKNCTLFKAGNICKKPIKSLVKPTPDPILPNPNASCAPGWVSREGLSYCYKVFHEERLTRKRSWEEAERFCQALGGHLPSFTNAYDMQVLHFILRDSISDNRFFWVGLNRRNPNNDNNWEWSDGRPVSMMIFPEEFNEDDTYNRDCVAFKVW